MPLVKGFRGLRFDPEVTGSLDAVITPPYDVISPEQRIELMGRSPHNMAHLILPEGEGDARYENAGRLLNDWIERGVLRRDEEESFYLLEQRFSGLDGSRLARRAFFGVGKLPEYGEKSYLDHERVFERKVLDRLALTEHTQANLGAVFMLYGDPEGRLEPFLGRMASAKPDIEARTIDGVEQRLWRVPADERVTEFLLEKTLYIADGHHRFRTACLYRDRMRAAEGTDAPRPYDYALMGFVAMEDPGLRVWPTHRLVDAPAGFDEAAFLHALTPWFEVAPVKRDLEAELGARDGCAIGLAAHDGGRYILRLRPIDRAALLGTDRTAAWRALDVAVLHRGILERILQLPEGTEYVYEPRFAAALAAVESGAKKLAFLLKGTPTEQICACAEAADPMPQKSTYFFPKLPSGGVIHRLI